MNGWFLPEVMTKRLWAVLGFLGGVLTGSSLSFALRDGQDDGSTLDYEDVLDAVDEAIALVDSDRVLFVNRAFEQKFGTIESEVHIGTALSSYPDLSECIVNRREEVVSVRTGESEIHYDVHLCPLTGDRDRTLVLLCDVTSEHEHRQHLEMENEHLDQFAGFVSHELRNPLDVAIGRTNAAVELNDDSEIATHLESTRGALTRMQRTVTGVLTLVRHGDEIAEREPVALEALAQEAWNTVDADRAALSVGTDAVVLGNRDGLLHILENLFSNAVEHGGDAVTVTVGSLDDESGFFVADDGVGISQERRQDILEPGCTGIESGTGLGLAIVSHVARAHGWDVDVADSEAGGARFEFSGVEFVSDSVSSLQQ